MSNIIIEHDDFQSTKSGFLIIATILALLFLLANLWIGLLSISLTVTLWTLKVGIEIDPNASKYRYFKSFYGSKSGKWEDLNNYKSIIVLKKTLKGNMLSPKLVNEISYKHIVFDVNLATANHRSKLSLKKYRSIDSAMDLAKKLNLELNLPIEQYNPTISQKTMQRRKNRK